CLCGLLGFPLVQEMCEWFPGEPQCPAFTEWLYKKQIFKRATGVLVISRAIEERVRQRAPETLVHRVPALVDAGRFAAAPPLPNGSDRQIPNFLYCGTWTR